MTVSDTPYARINIAGLARSRAWSLTVYAAMTVWAVTLFALVRDHYLHYRIGRFDLGNMVQAVWSTSQGRPLAVTDALAGEQTVRLASHVDPVLALLAPLWIVFPSPLMLIAVQSGAIAAGALPVFWLARRHLASERAAALLAIAYLAYPWTAWAVVDVFHPISLALPLLLFAVWFLDGDRLVPFAILRRARGRHRRSRRPYARRAGCLVCHRSPEGTCGYRHRACGRRVELRGRFRGGAGIRRRPERVPEHA